MSDCSTYLARLEDIVRCAGHRIVELEGTASAVGSEKDFRDYVTRADTESESLIIAGLERLELGVPIMTEESSPTVSDDVDTFWVIDPLDGTMNYMHGHPTYAVSVGLIRQGRPALGVVYAPRYDELFSACSSKGSTLNGVPIRVSANADLDAALLVAGFSQRHAAKSLPLFSRFWREAQAVRHVGSAALDLCYVACGRYDGFWELLLQPWDFGAGALIVEEAGGKISTFAGNELNYATSGSVLASNRLLHAAIEDVIAEAT